MSQIRLANAPVSYGAFEVTVGRNPDVPDGRRVLQLVADAGYEGIDLGPPGYLGRNGELGGNLAAAGLALAGGYLAVPFSVPGAIGGSMRELDALLDAFDAVAATGPALRPRPTIADAGSPERAGSPRRAAHDRGFGLEERGWRRLADGVLRLAARTRERGYEPTFHHHAGTYVEAPWEIERLLEMTDVGLCLDTGHLLIGGGDPVRAVRDWGARIDHVHLKDANEAIVEDVVAESAPMIDVWTRGAFVALGTGDADVDGVLTGLSELDYRGWIVVEQDRIPGPGDSAERAAGDQAANREFLRARGL
ncbi:MAG: TIM barrel protein [Actinomycetota bacterium]